MFKIILPLLLLISSSRVFGDTLDLGAHGIFNIEVPANWKFFSQPIQDKGFAAALRPTSGVAAGLKITILYLPQPKPVDEAKLKADLLRVCDQYVSTSVEQAKNLKNYGVKSGFGQYCVFTDASLVGKPEVSGEFKVIAPGVIQMTDDVIIVLTGVAQDATGSDFAAMLAAIKSIEIVPSK